MTVDIDKLVALLEVLTKENVAEFEHESEGTRIRIVRGGFAPMGMAPMMAMSQHGHAPPAPGSVVDVVPDDVIDVTSPFVGTFYRSPSPDAPPFVEVGSVVRPG